MKINISKSYDKVIVYNNFSLEIIDHKINVIIGKSGCGKTTLLQCIAGLIEYEGEIIPKVDSIGYVFQEDRLFPYLTVMKNLLIIDNDYEKVNALLDELNVADLKNKFPHQLSGGEKQRISLIRAFLGSNELILMDEPFKSLDYQMKQYLVEMLYTMQKLTDKTVILVTHDIDIALYLGHYIHVLSDKVTTLMETIYINNRHMELDEDSIKLLNKLKRYMTAK